MKWAVEKDRGNGYRHLHLEWRQGGDARGNSQEEGCRGPRPFLSVVTSGTGDDSEECFGHPLFFMTDRSSLVVQER
jgi:hypothetical protein